MPASLPLTLQQQWLWKMLQQHHDWQCAVPHVYRMRGPLSIDALELSFADILNRHSSLRARVVVIDGTPRQRIEDAGPCRFPVVHVSGASQEQREAKARELFESFCDEPMDALAPRLMRVVVLELGPEEHWLMLAMHRMISDCTSTEIVLKDVWAAYAHRQGDSAHSLQVEPGQYTSYAIWQHHAADEWQKRHEPYWLARLAGATCVRWPADEDVGRVRRGVVSKMSARFDATLSEQLHQLGRMTRTLTATVMLAVYVIVIWKWSKQHDFIVPLKIAGRQTAHKTVVGYFPHLLYLRITLSGEDTFSQLLSQVANEFFRALSHQDFGRTVLRVPELLAGTFFQWITRHAHEHAELGTSQSSHLRVERVPVREFGDGLTAVPPGVVDVEVTFFDTAQGIYASGVYRADQFTLATMDRFMADLRAVAEQIVRDPHARVATACAGA